MKKWIVKYRVNKLANNTGWMLLGQGLCLFIQAVYFVIIARSLGVQQYGAAAAFAQILSPFVGLGGGNLLVKNVVQDKRLFPVYWGNLLFMTLTSGLASGVFVIAVARLVLPPSIPLLVIVLVSLADLLFSRLDQRVTLDLKYIESWSLDLDFLNPSENGTRRHEGARGFLKRKTVHSPREACLPKSPRRS